MFVPRFALLGLDNVMITVSLDSKIASSTILAILMVSCTSAGLKVNVPLAKV